MTDIPGMIIWTDAYFGDTHHLTMCEHGAYLLILMAMWRNGGKLANSSKNLAMLAHTTPDKWRKIEKNIMDFMTLLDGSDSGYITQKRLWQEFNLAKSRNEKRIKAGALGGMAKALKNNKLAGSNASGNGKASPYNSNTNSKYKDSLNGGKGKEREATVKLVFVPEDSPQWNAWTKRYHELGKPSPTVTCRKGTFERGWYFPSEWPPTTPQP